MTEKRKGNNGRRVSLTAGACLLAVTLLLGCSKEPEGAAGGDRTEIVPRVALPVSATAERVAVRSVADPSQEMTLWFLRSDETASGVWGDYGAAPLSAKRTAGAGEQNLTFDDKQYYRFDGSATRMTGWYPEASSYADGVAHWTIDGGQDILLAAPREGCKTAAMPAFEFKHALAQVQFYVYAENEEAARQWGQIRGITIRQQRNQAAFTPADATADAAPVVFSGDPEHDFMVADLTAAEAPVGRDEAVTAGSPVMIEAQKSDYQLIVMVETEHNRPQQTVARKIAYRAGTKNSVYICLTEIAVLIDPTITISDWTSDGESSVKGAVTVLDGKTIVIERLLDNDIVPITHDPWTSTPAHEESAWDADASGFNTVSERFEVAGADAIAASSWADAAGHCLMYSEASGATTTWRLPTIRELQLICALRNDLNPDNRPSDFPYWSATESSSNSSEAWRMDFTGSDPYNTDPKVDPKHVRCVRDDVANPSYPIFVQGKIFVFKDKGGQVDDVPTHEPWASTPHHKERYEGYNASGFNTVGERFEVATSNAVGKDGSSEMMTWYEASGTTHATDNPNGYSACDRYSQDGKTGWRLPTIRELRAIYANKAQLTSANLPSDNRCWSATESDAGETNAFSMYFTNEGSFHTYKGGPGRVRCVRDL